MDNSKSFSLQFNPLMNVKCVKDYEEEISQLKNENFQLKAQLTHSNLPKVLYENQQEVDAILRQKEELQNGYENLNRAYENLSHEKQLLENKYNQELTLFNEKNGILEDENKRLIMRLEKLNKEVQETNNIKTELNRAVNEANMLRESVLNLEKQKEQSRYDFEQQVQMMKGEFEQFRRDIESEIKNKDFEIETLKKKLEISIQKEKNNSFIISDLKATLNSQMKEKSIIDEIKTSENMLKRQLEDLKQKKQQAEQELKEYQESINKEQKVYLNGMDKFKSLILQKLSAVTVSLVDLEGKISAVRTFCYISEENRVLISKLRLRYSNINDIITFFKDKHAELYRRMETMKKETAESTKNTIDKKTQTILVEFKNQFNEAKNELMICKKYLEKKAAENKALKNENARLMSETLRKNKQFDGMLKMM